MTLALHHDVLLALFGLSHIYWTTVLSAVVCQRRPRSCPQRNIPSGTNTHTQLLIPKLPQSHPASWTSIIPIATLEHVLPFPSIMEMLRNEGQEQHGCWRSSAGETERSSKSKLVAKSYNVTAWKLRGANTALDPLKVENHCPGGNGQGDWPSSR